jgi:apolipoprotein D and lipocalin family protein
MKALILGLVLSASSSFAAPPSTVESVDLERYMGTWYEIASFPQSFQKGCTMTKAEYTLRKNGKVSVLNSCRLGSPDGKLKSAKGRARVVDRETNSKLKVSFFWPFEGDYWILGLDEDYQWALVGSPDRDSLWILARERQIAEDTIEEILELATNKGFEIQRLVRQRQE